MISTEHMLDKLVSTFWIFYSSFLSQSLKREAAVFRKGSTNEKFKGYRQIVP
jgi:hypothetical protein